MMTRSPIPSPPTDSRDIHLGGAGSGGRSPLALFIEASVVVVVDHPPGGGSRSVTRHGSVPLVVQDLPEGVEELQALVPLRLRDPHQLPPLERLGSGGFRSGSKGSL